MERTYKTPHGQQTELGIKLEPGDVSSLKSFIKTKKRFLLNKNLNFRKARKV